VKRFNGLCIGSGKSENSRAERDKELRFDQGTDFIPASAAAS